MKNGSRIILRFSEIYPQTYVQSVSNKKYLKNGFEVSNDLFD
ncbi:hypothetical protein CF65_00155 [Aggregatibacter actinomycetemcomitans HK1651]|nr:hypothetical protein CF65_00155 [Aggregatibacter actinomycetemcomitans HK1651]